MRLCQASNVQFRLPPAVSFIEPRFLKYVPIGKLRNNVVSCLHVVCMYSLLTLKSERSSKEKNVTLLE